MIQKPGQFQGSTGKIRLHSSKDALWTLIPLITRHMKLTTGVSLPQGTHNLLFSFLRKKPSVL